MCVCVTCPAEIGRLHRQAEADTMQTNSATVKQLVSAHMHTKWSLTTMPHRRQHVLNSEANACNHKSGSVGLHTTPDKDRGNLS